MKNKILILFLLIGTLTFVSSLSLVEQFGVCEELNIVSLTECVDFWYQVENFTDTYNISVDDFFENRTIIEYVNQTQNVTRYVEIEKNCSSVDLSLVDDFKSRGFEPVFENGEIVNWKKISNESCSSVGLTDAQCEERVDARCGVASSTTPTTSSDQIPTYYYFIGFILIVAFLWYLMKKRKPQVPVLPEYYHRQDLYPPQNLNIPPSPTAKKPQDDSNSQPQETDPFSRP